MPPKKMDAEKCKEFAKNPAVNPLTGRAIDPAGATAKALAKDCEKLTSAAGPSRPAAPPAPAAGFEVNDFLTGKQVVFSGFRSKEYADLLATVNCVVSDNVTKATFLVVASDPEEKSGKLEKARKMKIPILSREKFVAGYLMPEPSLSSSSETQKSASSDPSLSDSASSSLSSGKKAEADRVKMLAEVAAVNKLFVAYYTAVDALIEHATEYKIVEDISDQMAHLEDHTEGVNSALGGLTEKLSVVPKKVDLSGIPLLAAKPGGKKRDPVVWKYSYDKRRETASMYLRKLFKKNQAVLMPGDVFVPVKVKYDNEIYFVTKDERGIAVAEYQYTDNIVSVPAEITKILMKSGKTVQQIAELYKSLPIRYVFYPPSQQDKMDQTELYVYNVKDKKSAYVSIDAERFYKDFHWGFATD